MDFESLRGFPYILVTGPQRSGTRIAAKVIAHDLQRRYVDEAEIGTDGLYALAGLLSQGEEVVVQCPALARDIHFFGQRDDALVVFMMRALEDILASQERIGWTVAWEDLEKFKYRTSRPIAAVKYGYWAYQRWYIKHYLELQYESLAGHPLWIPKDRRVNFDPLQTEV